MSGRWWLRRLGLVAGASVLVAGCGGSSAPSDAVPALGDSLDRVDGAIVDGRYDDARSELDELVGTTTSAQENGDLDSAEADRILAAAAQVASALPAEEPESSEPSEPSEPEPTPEPSPEETPEDSGSDEEAEQQEELEKEQEKLEKEQEKLEEEQQKDAEDDGNGDGEGEGEGNGGDEGGDD